MIRCLVPILLAATATVGGALTCWFLIPGMWGLAVAMLIGACSGLMCVPSLVAATFESMLSSEDRKGRSAGEVNERAALRYSAGLHVPRAR